MKHDEADNAKEVSYGQVEDAFRNPFEVSWDVGIGSRYPLIGRYVQLLLHAGLSLRGNFRQDDDSYSFNNDSNTTVGIYGAGGLELRLSGSLSLFLEGEWMKYTNQGALNIYHLNPSLRADRLRFGLSFHPYRN